MGTYGSFGYKIGKKIRLMQVDSDADLLWQICVREIYVLIKHYGSVISLKEKFDNLKDAKGKPKKDISRVYSGFNIDNEEWSNILRFCQHSFINVLDSGYFLNNGIKHGLVFILDFNTNEVILNAHNWNPQTKKYDNIVEYNKVTIDEIMEFEDMPTKSMTEILIEMKDKFSQFQDKINKIQIEKDRIQGIIDKAKELGNDHNILERAKKLMDDMNMEKRKLELQYRYFYNRLDALNLIDHS